ncbi:hypothetical protein MY11210_009501 [Beauveria gryllotalpidicola]
MSFSITPRVFSVLCLTVVSVAGQWRGNYNTTAVPHGKDPASHCWIKSLASRPYTAIYPCTCTGGEVAADCNWNERGILYNSVRNADCKCATTRNLQDIPESLNKYSQSQRHAVTLCVCDPPDGEWEAGTDGLVVPAPNCWCPTESLKNSGLKEVKEGQAVPETPPSIDAASVQKCRDDLNKSNFIQKNVCKQLLEDKQTEFSDYIQASIPNCTIALLTEVCKGISQD